MATRTRQVSRIGRGNRLPEDLREVAVVGEHLEGEGFFEEAGKRLRLSRRGGYGAPAMVAYLLAFFLSGARGLRPFYDQFRQWLHELAAICALRQLPSSASMSRGLSVVSVEQAWEFGVWLLQEAVDHRPLLEHEGAQTVDCQGTAWHVLDYDPKIDAFRQRALPEGEDLPEPERRLEKLASPGYPGRKRGEVQLARGLVQHSGTGLWLGASIGPGNGKSREDLARAVAASCRWATTYGVPQNKVIMRFDGGVGCNVPNVTTCREGGVNFVTRLSRYELLDLAAEHLEGVEWAPVEDSGSGPRREAAEFGCVTLSPKSETRRMDGQPYAPVEVRVVVSRFASPKKRGAGLWRNGYQYELFATDLQVDGWPAAEVVTGYYGRCGQENRFAQEDREVQLNRLFCCHLGGQLLATLVGQFVWNLRTCRGALLVGAVSPPSCGDDGPSPRDDQPADPDVDRPTDESEVRAAATSTTPKSTPPKQPHLSALSAGSVGMGQQSADAQGRVAVEHGRNGRHSAHWLATIALLGTLAWSNRLRSGWKFVEGLGLVCPNDQPIPLYRISQPAPNSVRIRFRGSRASCAGCPIRARCTQSVSRTFRKDVEATVPVDEFSDVAALENLLTEPGSPSTPREPPPPPWRPPSPPTARLPGSCRWPRLLPAHFRRQHRNATRHLEVTVSCGRLPPTQSSSSTPWLATGPADRQHLRLTHSQRLERNQLPKDATVQITYGAKTDEAGRLVGL